MLKQRLIGVITVKSGLAVQSIGYQRYLPLGRPCILAENLDRWGVDEILIQCIDRSTTSLGPDFSLIRSIADKGISTPLVYGGGISTPEQARLVISNGADRILLESAFLHRPDSVRQIAFALGSQALIASVPLTYTSDRVALWDYTSKGCAHWPSTCSDLLSDCISEVLIIDKDHEGVASSFDMRLLDTPWLQHISLIAFGGISSPLQVDAILSHSNVTAVAIGNFLNYREHAVQGFKQSLVNLPIRPPSFLSQYSF
jgi:cyclase